jgi:hypothetical protein
MDTKKPRKVRTEASVFSNGKQRPVIITVESRLLRLRLFRDRNSYTVPIEWLYKQAVAMEKEA